MGSVNACGIWRVGAAACVLLIASSFVSLRAEPGKPAGLAQLLTPVLPPGWVVEGREEAGDAVRVPGYRPAPGNRIRLVHRPSPDSDKNSVGVTVYLRGKSWEWDRAFAGRRAEFAGHAALGNIFLGECDPLALRGRWGNAVADICHALGGKASGAYPLGAPDWGRAVSRVLRDAASVARKSPLLLEFAHAARTDTGTDELARIRFNAAPLAKAGNAVTLVDVSVRPWLPDERATKGAVAWDGKSAERRHFFSGPDVCVRLRVLSPDTVFVREMNAILDRALSEAIAGWRKARGHSERGPRVDVPEGIHVSLAAGKAEYVIGEPVQIRIEVTGEGGQVEVGGDYRGTTRPLRYMLRAWNESGDPVADPDPVQNCMGGLCGPRKLPYGITLNALQWCRLDAPGEYRIGVAARWGWPKARDGWEEGTTFPHRTYLGQVSIALREPNAEDAARVIKEALALPMIGNGDTIFDRRAVARGLFHPAYLPHLRELASSHDAEVRKVAVLGMGSILTPEATRLLIGMLDDKDRSVVAHVAVCLRGRMPNRGRTYYNSPSQTSLRLLGRERMRRAWSAEVQALALAWARRRLPSGEGEQARWAAEMIQHLGAPEDLDLLAQCIDRVAPRWCSWLSVRRPDLQPDGYDQPELAVDAAERAAAVLLLHGARPKAHPVRPGDAVLWAVALRYEPLFRPDGWEQTVASLLRSDLNVVRYKTLRNMPLPVPETAVPLVARSLHDPDGGIRCAAGDLVAASGAEAFRKDALAQLRVEQMEWPLKSIINAASKVARDQIPDVAVERLTDGDTTAAREMFWVLVDWAVRDRSSCGQNGALFEDVKAAETFQKNWREWIAKNRDAVREGHGLPLDDPRFSGDLFPKSVQFSDGAGNKWPPTRNE